jgi:hypothetical protein
VLTNELCRGLRSRCIAPALLLGLICVGFATRSIAEARVRVLKGYVVLVRREVSTNIAEDFDALEGDLIEAGPGSEAIISHCAEVSRLEPGIKPIRITACVNGTFARLAELMVALYPKFVSDKDVSGGRNTGEQSNLLAIVFPANNTVVLTPAPSFAWRGPAGPYEVAIYDEKMSESIWTIQTNGENRIEYPKTRPQLLAGKSYFWEVRRLSGIESASASFAVLSASDQREVLNEKMQLEEQLARVKANETVRFLALAGLFLERRLQTESVVTIEQGIRQAPDSKELSLARDLLVREH